MDRATAVGQIDEVERVMLEADCLYPVLNYCLPGHILGTLLCGSIPLLDGCQRFPLNYYVPFKTVLFYCIEIGFYIPGRPFPVFCRGPQERLA